MIHPSVKDACHIVESPETAQTASLYFLGVFRSAYSQQSIVSDEICYTQDMGSLGGDFMLVGRVVLHLSVMIIVTKSLFSAPALSETISQIKSIPGWSGAI